MTVFGHSPSLILLHSFSPSSLVPVLAANPIVNYANVLLIRRLQAAVETRTAIVQTRLIHFLCADFICCGRTRYMIADFMHLDFVSTPSSEDRIDIVREEYKDALLRKGNWGLDRYVLFVADVGVPPRFVDCCELCSSPRCLNIAGSMFQIVRRTV